MSDPGSQTPYPSQPPPGVGYQAPVTPAWTGKGSGPRANFGQRLVALLVDWLVLLVPNVILILLLSDGLAQALGALVGIVYFASLEGGPTGQTVGKRTLGIRVIDLRAGGPIGYGRAVLRYIGRILSTIVVLLGYFWMIWDAESQTWHDKIAGSVVVPVDAYPVD